MTASCNRDSEPGAITFVQRFGGSLNLHVHLHVIVPDGVFVRDGSRVRFRGRALRFEPDGARVAPRANGSTLVRMSLHLTAELETAYGRFVERVATSDEVWVLVAADRTGAVVPSHHLAEDDGELVSVELVFSDRAYAARLAREEWEGYAALRLPLGNYLNRVLPALAKRGALVMPNANADLAGLEVRPDDLRAAVLAAKAGGVPDLRFVQSPIDIQPLDPLHRH